jgi:hypothetical protein
MTEKPRFIFSLTTSPTRINTIEQTINSLINQSYKATHIRINIPNKFGRTGEEYVIPEFLLNNEYVKIHRCEIDYGPATKLVPSVIDACSDATENDWIVTVDDDINYQPFLLEELSKTILQDGRRNTYGVSACRIVEYNLNGSNSHSLCAFYDNIAGDDIILEAYCAIAYPRKELFSDLEHFKTYINETLLVSKECKFSDDVVLSNYSIMRGNKNYLVFGNVLCRPRFWADGCVRDVGNKDDALHLMNDWDSPQTRYIKVFDFLREKKLLHLNILKMTPDIGPFSARITQIQSDSPYIANGKKRKMLELFWNFIGKAKDNINSIDYNTLQQVANAYSKQNMCFNVSFINEKKGIAANFDLK